MPFAVALFSLLVLSFGHDPHELLAGDMESASRIRVWFDRIFTALNSDARSLLSCLALLDVPFNIGVMKAVARGSSILDPGPAFEALQKHFLVSRHTRYRWIVHQLLRVFARPKLTNQQRSDMHSILGKHFLRGLPRKRSELLAPDQFHSKVLAFRHLSNSPDSIELAHSILEELSGTAKARAHHALFLELSQPTLGAGTATSLWLTYHHAHCALVLGQAEYCRQLVEPLLEHPIVTRNPTMRLSFSRLISEALGSSSQNDAAIASLRAAIAAACDALADAADLLPLRHAKSSLSWLLTRGGQHLEAARFARELLAQAQGKNDARGGAIAWTRLGMAQSGAGQFEEALESLDAAVDLFRQEDNRRGVAWALLEAGECRLKRGAAEQAEQNLRSAFTISTEIGESSTDFQECLARILALSPPPAICLIVLQEQQRIQDQLASQRALLLGLHRMKPRESLERPAVDEL